MPFIQINFQTMTRSTTCQRDLIPQSNRAKIFMQKLIKLTNWNKKLGIEAFSRQINLLLFSKIWHIGNWFESGLIKDYAKDILIS